MVFSSSEEGDELWNHIQHRANSISILFEKYSYLTGVDLLINT